MDALQVFVQGFGTQVAEKRIVEVLEDHGFAVLDRSTEGGGQIETHICEVAFLHNDGDIGSLRAAVLAVSPAKTDIRFSSFFSASLTPGMTLTAKAGICCCNCSKIANGGSI